ncbi:ribonuclease P protein component [Pirellulaceae bacterium SH449]
MSDQSFPSKFRIKSRLDFDRVFREGVVVADNVLVLHAIPRRIDRPDPPRLEFPRLGLSVSKRVGNAPTRNKWKRLIREAFRKQRIEFPPLDIVVRPKKGAEPVYEAIYASLPTLVARAQSRIARTSS